MNLSELFQQLSQLPIFAGLGLGITLALLLSLAYVLERWPLKLLLLLAIFGVLGVVVSSAFPAYYGLLIWISGLFSAGLLAIAYDQEPDAAGDSEPLTPLRVISLISAPLLITAVSGLAAFWPATFIAPTFGQRWAVILLLALSLWQLLRVERPLGRTVGFLGFAAGLGLWQTLRLAAADIVLVWALFSLLTTFLGTLFHYFSTADRSDLSDLPVR